MSRDLKAPTGRAIERDHCSVSRSIHPELCARREKAAAPVPTTSTADSAFGEDGLKPSPPRDCKAGVHCVRTTVLQHWGWKGRTRGMPPSQDTGGVRKPRKPETIPVAGQPSTPARGRRRGFDETPIFRSAIFSRYSFCASRNVRASAEFAAGRRHAPRSLSVFRCINRRNGFRSRRTHRRGRQSGLARFHGGRCGNHHRCAGPLPI